jgi:hypothetical protein
MLGGGGGGGADESGCALPSPPPPLPCISINTRARTVLSPKSPVPRTFSCLSSLEMSSRCSGSIATGTAKKLACRQSSPGVSSHQYLHAHAHAHGPQRPPPRARNARLRI